MYIAVAGNIGSGKTTLTKMLSKYYGWKQYLEPVAENPYIDDYYKDISRWALNMEVFYLKQRFKNLLEIQHSKETVIQDMELFESMMEVVEMPELMIYLRSSVPHLVKNIQKRGRDYEQRMPIDYLEGINRLYDDFIMNKYKGRVLVVEVDDLDFEHNPKQFGDIVDKIDAKLFGLFSKEE